MKNSHISLWMKFAPVGQREGLLLGTVDTLARGRGEGVGRVGNSLVG